MQSRPSVLRVPAALHTERSLHTQRNHPRVAGTLYFFFRHLYRGKREYSPADVDNRRMYGNSYMRFFAPCRREPDAWHFFLPCVGFLIGGPFHGASHGVSIGRMFRDGLAKCGSVAAKRRMFKGKNGIR